jgi:4-hydroxybenzoate polyprenyltransferase/phosphoserine phosphatase
MSLIFKEALAVQAKTSVSRTSETPLCVDLDGTLLRSDILFEALTRAVRRPSILLKLPLWLLRGRAFLKAQLAKSISLDVRTLPYNHALLQFIQTARSNGRKVVLATGSDHAIATRIAEHLGVFDEVIASDGVHNLTGKGKAKVLHARFGSHGFSYAGNDRADLEVWKLSRSAVVVGPTARFAEQVAELTEVEAHLPDGSSKLGAFIRLLRPYQWSKNLLVFVPIITANALSDWAAWGRCAGLFLAMNLMASVLYVLNDLTDLESDRIHPQKQGRPFAAGDLPLWLGFAILPPGIALAVAVSAMGGSTTLVGVYGASSLAYSWGLKQFPLVDLFMLTGIYGIRLFAGGVLSGYLVSVWLLTFSGFLFFSLATIKRIAEISAWQAQRRVNARRGYLPADLLPLQGMGIAASFVSCLVLALYVQSPTVQQNYLSPDLLWGITALSLFWQCRLWLATSRGFMLDDPIVYAAKDWVSWLVALVTVVLLALAHSDFSPWLRAFQL